MSSEIKKSNSPKRKEMYKETFKKGVIFPDKEKIIAILKNNTSEIELVNQGDYNNGTSFITIKINHK